MTYSERERDFSTSRSLISSILQIYVRGARSRLSLRARRDHDPALNSTKHWGKSWVLSPVTWAPVLPISGDYGDIIANIFGMEHAMDEPVALLGGTAPGNTRLKLFVVLEFRKSTG